MKESKEVIFPDFVCDLAQADYGSHAGDTIIGYLVQGDGHQVVFNENTDPITFKRHRHEASFGVVLQGQCEFVFSSMTTATAASAKCASCIGPARSTGSPPRSITTPYSRPTTRTSSSSTNRSAFGKLARMLRANPVGLRRLPLTCSLQRPLPTGLPLRWRLRLPLSRIAWEAPAVVERVFEGSVADPTARHVIDHNSSLPCHLQSVHRQVPSAPPRARFARRSSRSNCTPWGCWSGSPIGQRSCARLPPVRMRELRVPLSLEGS